MKAVRTAKLSSTGGDVCKVSIAITAGRSEEIQEVVLKTNGIPDGYYALEYFYRKSRRDYVHIKDGAIVKVDR